MLVAHFRQLGLRLLVAAAEPDGQHRPEEDNRHNADESSRDDRISKRGIVLVPWWRRGLLLSMDDHGFADQVRANDILRVGGALVMRKAHIGQEIAMEGDGQLELFGYS